MNRQQARDIRSGRRYALWYMGGGFKVTGTDRAYHGGLMLVKADAVIVIQRGGCVTVATRHTTVHTEQLADDVRITFTGDKPYVLGESDEVFNLGPFANDGVSDGSAP